MTGAANEHLEYLARRRRNKLLGVAAAVILGWIFLQSVSHTSRGQWLARATMDELRQELRANPADDEAARVLALRLIEKDDLQEAAEVMRAAVKHSPNSADNWLGMGRAASQLGEAIEAANAYRKAAELDPKNGNTRLTLGALYADAGLFTDAMREYEAAAKIDPQLRYNGPVRGKSLADRGRLDEAFDRLIDVIHKEPMRQDLYDLLAEVGMKANKLEDTETALRYRLSITRAYPVASVRYQLVRVLLARSKSPQMLKEAEEQLDVCFTDPTILPEYYALLGHVRLLRSNVEGAEEAVNKGLALKGDSLECLAALADLREKQGKSEEAGEIRARVARAKRVDTRLAPLRQKVEAAPTDIEARMALARALSQAGKHGEAAEQCQIVLESRPDKADAVALLATSRDAALRMLSRRRTAELK